jgi:hypothetical protein
MEERLEQLRARLTPVVLAALTGAWSLDERGGGTGENMVLRGLSIVMAIAAMGVLAAAVATHLNAVAKAVTGAGA